MLNVQKYWYANARMSHFKLAIIPFPRGILMQPRDIGIGQWVIDESLHIILYFVDARNVD